MSVWTEENISRLSQKTGYGTVSQRLIYCQNWKLTK